METLSPEAQYQLMKGWLNERQWRLYVATEARRIGPGGISQVAREAGVTRKTIRKGLGELEVGALYQPGERIRQQGGGRKKNTVKDATLRADLEGMLDPKGDPESLLRWTSKEVEQVEESPHAPRAYDWGDRHPGDVTRDGLFPQSHQEEH